MKCPTGARGVVVTFNEGTSEGAKKGWETRGGVGKAAQANRATDKADALEQASAPLAERQAAREAAIKAHFAALVDSRKRGEIEESKYHHEQRMRHARKLEEYKKGS